MKSKLEEKKLELADKQASTYQRINTSYSSSYRVFSEGFKTGFDAGISAYKEMLEGVEVEGARVRFMCDDESKWQGLGMRITDDAAIKFIEALPVLAKLQQQAEKIEGLEKDLKHEQNLVSGYIDCANNFKSKITELESRLKEAESVIGFYGANESWLTSNTGDNSEHFGDLITVKDLEEDSPITKRKFVGGKLARQYMEKVK